MATATRTSFLDSFSDSDRTTLVEACTARDFKSGDILLTEGAAGDSMLVLSVGKAEVVRGEVTLDRVGQGAVIGEMSLLDPAPRSASVIATSSGTAHELPHATFQEMLDAGDPIALTLLSMLTGVVCERLGHVTRLIQAEVIKPEAEGGFKGLWKRIRSAL